MLKLFKNLKKRGMVYDRCFSYFYCTAGVTGSDNAGIYGGHYRTGTDTHYRSGVLLCSINHVV